MFERGSEPEPMETKDTAETFRLNLPEVAINEPFKEPLCSPKLDELVSELSLCAPCRASFLRSFHDDDDDDAEKNTLTLYSNEELRAMQVLINNEVDQS
jgi:hypothetical protein